MKRALRDWQINWFVHDVNFEIFSINAKQIYYSTKWKQNSCETLWKLHSRNNKWDTQTNTMAKCNFPTIKIVNGIIFVSPSLPHSGNSKNFNVNFKIQSINRSMAWTKRELCEAIHIIAVECTNQFLYSTSNFHALNIHLICFLRRLWNYTRFSRSLHYCVWALSSWSRISRSRTYMNHSIQKKWK